MSNALARNNPEVRIHELKFTLIDFLMDEIFERFSVDDICRFDQFDRMSSQISALVEQSIQEFYKPLAHQKEEIVFALIKSIFGFGVLESFLDDPTVSEIMVRGTDAIYLRIGDKLRTAKNAKGEKICFQSYEEILWILKKLFVGNPAIDMAQEAIFVALPEGVAMHIIPAGDQTVITIRK